MPNAIRTGLALAVALSAAAALADDDAPEKRAEGRYFVEVAEIMLRAGDFDALIANVDPDGIGPGAAADDVAELSAWNLQQPKVTIGLNRPGKTSLSFTFHDFELSDRRVPLTFEDAGGQIVSSDLIPPGIQFQRQSATGGFVPNWGEEYGFIRRMDYRSLDLSVQRTAYENERFRLRLIGGLRYAELAQKLSIRIAFAEEGSTFGNEVRDYYSMSASAGTHGLGPHFGLGGRYLVGKDKNWVFHAQADVAMLPESTNLKYLLSLVDFRLERESGFYIPAVGAPVMPGVPATATDGNTFNSEVLQTDFTDITWLLEATFGVRYQINKGISVGVEGWFMQWTNLITDADLIDAINRSASYEIIPGQVDPDPQLQDAESVIHMPRVDSRSDVAFDGVSLNLRFEF